MTSTFVGVKVYKRPLKKLCLHCGRHVIVTAFRKDHGYKLPVSYCQEHAEMRGAV